ncbi:MAG: hypothetical protein ACRD1Z_06565, partial [Vicinamibacteria bacterium]
MKRIPLREADRLSALQRIRFLLEMIAVRGIAAVVSRLPRAAMLALGEFLGRVMYRIARSWRLIALDNLSNAFGDSK